LLILTPLVLDYSIYLYYHLYYFDFVVLDYLVTLLLFRILISDCSFCLSCPSVYHFDFDFVLDLDYLGFVLYCLVIILSLITLILFLVWFKLFWFPWLLCWSSCDFDFYFVLDCLADHLVVLNFIIWLLILFALLFLFIILTLILLMSWFKLFWFPWLLCWSCCGLWLHFVLDYSIYHYYHLYYLICCSWLFWLLLSWSDIIYFAYQNHYYFSCLCSLLIPKIAYNNPPIWQVCMIPKNCFKVNKIHLLINLNKLKKHS
jgi:hypothetical protein